MRISKTTKYALVVAIAVLVCVLASVYWWRSRIVSDVKIFAPPEWRWLEGKVELMVFPDSSELLMRVERDAPPKPDFDKMNIAERANYMPAIRASDEQRDAWPLPQGVQSWEDLKPVYYFRYDPVGGRITTAPETAWDEERGEVSRCFRDGYVPRFVQFASRSVYMTDFAKEVRQSAKRGRHIRMLVSPTVQACSTNELALPQDVAATYRTCRADLEARRGDLSGRDLLLRVSAEPDSQMSLLGGSVEGSSEQHYQQIMSLPEMEWIGDPVRIPMVTVLGDRWPKPGWDRLKFIGWSADDRFIVYVGQTSLCVVHVDLDRASR